MREGDEGERKNEREIKKTVAVGDKYRGRRRRRKERGLGWVTRLKVHLVFSLLFFNIFPYFTTKHFHLINFIPLSMYNLRQLRETLQRLQLCKILIFQLPTFYFRQTF